MAYKSVLIDLYNQNKTNDTFVNVTRDQLRDLFQYAVGNMPVTPAKFTKLIKHRGLDIDPIRVSKRLVRGIQVKLHDINEEETIEALGLTADKRIRRVK